jgi:hypothetical protein
LHLISKNSFHFPSIRHKTHIFPAAILKLAGFPILKRNLKHVSRGCGGTPKRSKVVERGCQPFEDSDELGHTNPIKERGRTLAKPATGLPCAADTPTMGDASTSTTATTKSISTKEST